MKPPKARRTLSTKIAIGLAAGIALGLFVGERASVLNVVADGYIKLLQMTVLPFVTVSIIGGLGALNGAQARALAKHVGLVLVLLWALALAMVFLFPLMFPPHESASFFSTTLIQEREPFDFLNLYIPTNPFNSLANNIVPAVVLFSVIVGAALMTIPEKARLLDVLAVISERRVEGDALRRRADAVRRLRDCRRRGGNLEPRRARAPQGLSDQLRRHVAADFLLAAARTRGGADAGALSRAPRPHARCAGDGVHDHEPAGRAAAPHRGGQGAGPRSTPGSTSTSRPPRMSSCRRRSTSRTRARCCRSASCCSPAGSPTPMSP